MQKFLQKIIIAMFGITLLVYLSLPSAFAQESVTVSLPTFKITMNDVVIDNSARLYPIIVYKDITYVPMTYNDSRFLGLETKWSADTGLQVNKITEQLSYNPNTGYANTALESASLPQFNTGVNGKTIDNNSETFPLLVFRDVTYFPLTWRYMVTEFGWTSSFDATNGLIINSKAVTTNSSNNTNNTNNNTNNNYNNNNSNSNNQNYSKQFNNITAIFDRSSNNQPGNLYIKENNSTKKIGNPNYIYGISYLQAGRRGEYTAVNNVDYTNRWVYTLAIDPSASTITSKSVRINIDTNEVQVIDGNNNSNNQNNNSNNNYSNNQNNNSNNNYSNNQNNNNSNNNGNNQYNNNSNNNSNNQYNNNSNNNSNNQNNNNQNYSQKFDNITVTLDRTSNKQAGNLYVKENNSTKKIGNPNYIYGVSYSKRPSEIYTPVNNLSLSNRWVYTLAIDPSASPLVSKNVRVNIDTNEVQFTNVAP